MTKNEKAAIATFVNNLKSITNISNIPDSIIKTAYCYHVLLNDSKNNFFPSLSKKLKLNLERNVQILKQIDFSFVNKDFKNHLENIFFRINKNIPVQLLELIKIPKIGISRAEKLYKEGFKTKQDILNDIEKASSLLKFNLKNYVK